MSILRNRQAVFALFLLVLNTGYLVEALSLPRPFQLGEPGPAFLPLVLAVVLYIACGRILYAELRGSGDPEGEPQPPGSSVVRPILLALATAAFIYAFEPFGYFVATPLYVFAVAALFEYESGSSPLRIAVVAAILAGAISIVGWLFFVTLFDLFLPEGNW